MSRLIAYVGSGSGGIEIFEIGEGGIPGVENVGDDAFGKEGGDFDEVTGKRCYFACFPWRFRMGEGSGVRMIAITDPEQTFRFETGEPVKK